MALNALDTADVIEVMENFIDKKRPSEDIRHKLDLSYRIENQSIFIWVPPETVFRCEDEKICA